MPHIHDKIDFCSEVFIVYQNKVLLRMHDKLGFWLSIGGHIELDEDPVEAAIREVREEVGLEISIVDDSHVPMEKDKHGYTYLIPPRYLGRHPVGDNHEHIVFVYFATTNSNMITDSVHEHERMETKWVTLEELNKMDLVPNVKFYATKALETLKDK